MSVVDELRIEGLDDFRRALRRLGAEYPKKLAQLNKAAGERVAASARSRYAARYTQRSGRGARAIRSLAQQRSAKVRIGSGTTPYLVGQEFGSNRYAQFAPWSGPAPGGGVGSRGKFLYPAIRQEMPELSKAYMEELDKLAREAFPR